MCVPCLVCATGTDVPAQRLSITITNIISLSLDPSFFVPEETGDDVAEDDGGGGW
ncbi:uncharacterized protein FOMMEDRAFT_142817 [Fomitiporia mediterranea MF3/22]|uniref:uncharacterized protein n=1 Tax=Fomitiporia mediterranea (strain MF3/22) TaxID=694068 RepID=UPI000440898E|nr:uncharacterized protein FOMMEDRAFT_142817 [Fomitiporia mediterranea MF3/22]EJC99197.1 hypothetical protein FOMMEDRAFT_142817 [Fomitiporia mediterranea MF3/22]